MADEEIDLDSITDEATLQKLLEETEEIDDRKAIRARIQEVRSENRAKRDEKLARLTNSREDALRKKKEDAEQQKQRTLAMYENMAKSAPAGGQKVMDIGIYKNNEATPPGTPTKMTSGPRDLVEDVIRNRAQAAEDKKKKILAAYDIAAKSGPAGVPREVNFDVVKGVDVSLLEEMTIKKEPSAATFQMTGGVPKVVKASPSQPGTPLSPGLGSGPNFPKEPVLDPMERAIRLRKQQAEERKMKTLAAYDMVAKTGCGPKLVCLEEFANLNEDKPKALTKFQQLDKPGVSPGARPNFRPVGAGINPSSIKEMLLKWASAKTRGYANVEITNFSSCWADGLAFCALIHHYYPDAFDYNSLDAKNRRRNFELAFKAAEEKADIAPLLDVEDMILMKNKPDWKCVFTYVQSMYRKLHDKD